MDRKWKVDNLLMGPEESGKVVSINEFGGYIVLTQSGKVVSASQEVLQQQGWKLRQYYPESRN